MTEGFVFVVPIIALMTTWCTKQAGCEELEICTVN